MKAEAEVTVLHGIGQALDVNDSLIEHDAVGKDIVRDREVIVGRSAVVEARSDPAVDLGATILTFERRHQGIDVGVGDANGGCSAVDPVGAGKRRGIERGGSARRAGVGDEGRVPFQSWI